MGRNRHSKDKLHLTATEWKRDWGGNKSDDPLKRNLPFRRLPFDCCSITFQPFTTPMADRQGHVFDLVSIMTYIMKHKSNPCTGQPLKSNQLIKLHFHKNTDGQYSCPITYKVFSAHTHIVFIATTGNVYAYDAVENLNIKPKYWCDLITGEKFAREDIITIQDPHNFSNRELSTFHHVTHHDATDDKEAKTEISVTPATQRVLDKIAGKTSTSTATTSTPSTISTTVRKSNSSTPTPTSTSTSTSTTPSVARSAYSSGACAASFTSTAQNVVTDNQRAALTEDEIREQRYAYFKKEKKGTKGYIRLCTNHGNLSFELACDLVPRTCHNFLELATRGYYDGTKFHRLISGFMLQGGDPTATGRGGEGAFKKKFEDEFHPSLTHSARGILSMANSGKNTNGSQFFITFKECSHLDNKHAVFGHLVGGHDVLSKLESIPVYGKNESKPADYPKQEIIITSVAVYTNPFAEEYIPTDEYTGKKVETKEPEKVESGSWFSAPQAVLKPVSEGIGKYIALPPPKQSDDKDSASKKRKVELSIPPAKKAAAATAASTSATSTTTSTSTSSSKPKASGGSFGNFSNW